MARIPEPEIDRIKREVSIVRLVESYGVKLTGSGDNLLGHCPLNGHSDGTPSFVVSPKKNLWHCMGACAVGGSVIDFVMQADRVSFRQAAESLQKQAVLSSGRCNTRTGRGEPWANEESTQRLNGPNSGSGGSGVIGLRTSPKQ